LSIPEQDQRVVSKDLQIKVDQLAKRAMNLPVMSPPAPSLRDKDEDQCAPRA
jgi:hypothetical protein